MDVPGGAARRREYNFSFFERPHLRRRCRSIPIISGSTPSHATFSDSTTTTGGYAGDINNDDDDDFDSFFKDRTKLGENNN